MECVVKFKDGYICKMELIYNWDKMHIYRTDGAYLLVPYGDVEGGKVEIDDFLQAQQDAKKLPTPKPAKPVQWKEVKE
jgi:hypothetical protein